MKKLGKLSINPEKVIKNEELVNLRGGYLYDCWCFGTDEHLQIEAIDLDEARDVTSEHCVYGGYCDIDPC